MIKLNIGAGGSPKPKADGWVNVDLRELPGIDVVTAMWDLRMYADGSVDEIYSRHAIEHCSLSDAQKTFTEWSRILKTGGVLNLSCPDLAFHMRQLSMSGKSAHGPWSNHQHAMAGLYGWQHHPDDVHKWGWTHDTMEQELAKRGLSVQHVDSPPHHMVVQATKTIQTKTPGHLGGHMGVTHVDGGALSYLIDTFGITSMVDVGCGPGGMLGTAMEKGLSVLGVDGDPSLNIKEDVPFLLHDFTRGTPDIGTFDLAWSVEFLEHMEEKYLDNVFGIFRRCSYVLCTHARPFEKAGRHHHVNCRDAAYWVDKFESAGFEHMTVATEAIREASSMNRDFVRNTGLVFKLRGGLRNANR